jgi:predicted enzyme related to lactoylglutathione lyase
VNGAPIASADDLEAAIARIEDAGGGVWALTIERNGRSLQTQVRI